MATLPLLMDFTEEQKEKIIISHERTPETIQVDVQIVQKWLSEQPHLPQGIFSARRILTFLILNKMSIEKTKRKLDMYFTIRKMIPEFFFETQPYQPKMQDLMKSISYIPIPKLTEDLYRPVILSFSATEIKKFDPALAFAHMLNVGEIRLEHDMMVGEITIWDLKNATLEHVSKLGPSVIKKGLTMFEKVYADRIKASHLINCPPFIDTFITFVKSLLTKKLADRIYSHKSVESLYEFIPQEYLPSDFGGFQPSMEKLQANWNKTLMDYSPWFDKLHSIEVDESLRPEKLMDDEVLGIYGNFRKLDVD